MKNIMLIAIVLLVFADVANAGSRYRIEIPYDPGEHIKMRIQFAPVI